MNGALQVGLIIAVKHLPAAKSRLAPIFSESVRQRLVIAMLTDTICATHEVSAVQRVTVVTPDQDVADAARRLGATVLDDPTQPDHPDPLNNALHTAWQSVVVDMPNIAVLQGDLPALTATELTAAIACAQNHQRSFIADRHGSGTSALFAFGCPLMPKFGADSARKHQETGAVELDGQWPGLRCDIDLPDDLRAAEDLGIGPATARVIHDAAELCPDRRNW